MSFPLPSQVNMIKDDGMVIHFNNPKVQASLAANTFAVTGHAETVPLTELLPGILTQLGSDSLSNLRQLAQRFPGPRPGAYSGGPWAGGGAPSAHHAEP